VPERDDELEVSARPFWSGTITFGLVSVPVNLLPANRSDRTSLRMVSPEGRPLSRRYFTTRDDAPLDWDDIVRGYEIEKDRFVVVDDDELERLSPERTRDIDLRLFVRASEIDPMHFERAYFLTPAGTSTKAYRLLARVMEDTGRAGIATFVMRAKEYLVAILAENGILRAETLRFADELRTPEDVGLPRPVDPPAARVREIEQEIAKLEMDELNPDELVERSAERLMKLVRKKMKSGSDVVKIEEEREDGGRVIDLVEMLQRSLQGGAGADRDGGNGGGRARSTSSRRGSNGRSNGSRRANGSRRRGLDELPKSELYERAKKLDIPGRSTMSKDELAEAVGGK
jgi:DNA end-binding protein Ku